MPVDKLYVEGKLDNEIYAALFGGSPAIVRGGSKYSVRPQARHDRESDIQAGYLRDRDFDFDPPENMNVPTVDAPGNNEPWGWRLNRHEIENYLLDPQVVAAKFGIESETWQNHLCDAGRGIRWYQIARWTVGYARANLPPNYKMETKPEDVQELRLPQDLGEQASLDWCRSTISNFLEMVDECLCNDAVGDQILSRTEQLSHELLGDHLQVLRWCSGKDLFAALSDAALQATGTESRQLLRNILRDWVIQNPENFIGFFPELVSLRNQITPPTN